MARRGVDEIKIELVLQPVEHLCPDNSILYPTEARNVKVPGLPRTLTGPVFFGSLNGKDDPRGLASLRVDDAQAHGWIRITSLGILLPIDGGMSRKVVGYGIGRDRSLVHLQINELLAVRGPEVIAADV